MSLHSRNIIFDTQYFISKSFDFDSAELQSLAELVNKGFVHVFLADITEREIRKKINEELIKAHQRLLSGDARYLKSIPLFKKFLDTYYETRLIQFFEEKFEDFKSKCQVEIISSAKVKPIDVFEDYCAQWPPFNNKKDKKSEFPDAFALNSISLWAGDKHTAYLLSGDEDWEVFAEQEYASWSADERRFWHIKELPYFIDLVYRTEEALSHAVSFADNLLRKRTTDVENAIMQKVKVIPLVCESAFDMEVDNAYFLSGRMEEKEIISAERDFAIYKIVLVADVIIRISEFDYENTPYDSEIGDYIMKSWKKFYERHRLFLSFDVEMIYTDGIENNFAVQIISSPGNITVPFEKGEPIDVDKWALQLPVIVCGAEKGEITVDGGGAMEFENLAAAQMVFPSLDLHSHTKDFTKALGNRLTEKLRFETSAASKFYSG